MTARKKNSTYTHNEKYIVNCDLTYALSMIGGRWKILILDKLDGKTLRFSDLKREFYYVTERMLTLQLKALEKDGLIKRKAYAEVPPRVEYELTEMGMALSPLLNQLSEWGGRQREQQQTS